METRNICLFVPYHKDYQSIHTVNFVLETEPQMYPSFRTESLYKVHLVRTGNGFLHTMGSVQPLSEGDIFFTFAGTPYRPESGENFSYQYVSFLGARANQIMERLGISPAHSVYPNCSALTDFWQKGLSVPSDLTDLISESVLLYTFSYIGNRVLSQKDSEERSDDLYLKLKKYIDDNFNDPELSLTSISEAITYHPKYLSALFKRRMGIGISEYISIARIQNACTLINQGLFCVSEIAALSGFRDALYFSKVFKKKIGLSPRSYIASLKK
ncbi:MAG TPA: hypothetical protein DDW30_07150 [Clostridiales bacterium]|nr:hypothetical protein [Clostridiales bacterium]